MNTLVACFKIMFGGDKANPPKSPIERETPPDDTLPVNPAQSPENPINQSEASPMRYLPISTRSIDTAFVHSTATKRSMNIGRDEIDRWHKDRGFNEIGYHIVIRRDGSTDQGRSVHKVGAHTRGHNKNSIGIVMVGGLSDAHGPEANFTRAQFRTLKAVIAEMKETYPGIAIKGHRDVAPTACPSFDVAHWMETGEVRA